MGTYLVFIVLPLLLQYASAYICTGEFQPNITTYTTVNTSRGSVIGTHVDLGSDKNQIYYGSGDVFLGIPYVQPPIGEYRWKRPVRLDKFTASPWNATFNKLACPQFYSDEISEDCLYLNIYTPSVSYF